MASGIPGKVNEPEYRVEESHYGRHDSTEDSSSSRKIFMILGIPDNCKPNNLERFMVNEAKQRQIPLQKLRIHIQGRETYGQRAYASLFLLENAETAVLQQITAPKEPFIFEEHKLCFIQITEQLKMLMPGEATKALEDCKEHETLLISNLPSDADEGTLKAFLIFKFKEKKTGMFIKSVKISGNFAQVRLKSKQGASRFVEENTELPFQDTVIKLSIESVAEEPSHVSISESSQGGSSVILIKGFPEKTNERQLKTFLIHCAKERKVKIGIGNIFIWQGSAYVKTTNKKGTVGLVEMAEEENMIFMKSILSVSQAVEIPSEVQEGLNKCIYIIVNCLKQEANEDNVKRLIVEELKERKIRLWIDSIKVKNTSAFIKVNSFPDAKKFIESSKEKPLYLFNKQLLLSLETKQGDDTEQRKLMKVDTEDEENDLFEDDLENTGELERRGDLGRGHGRGRQRGRGSQHHRGRGPSHEDENGQNIRHGSDRGGKYDNRTGRGHERGRRGSVRGSGDEYDHGPTRGRGNEVGRGQRHGHRRGRGDGRGHRNQQSDGRGSRQESQQQNILDGEDSFVMDETGNNQGLHSSRESGQQIETRYDSDVSEETYSLSSISDDNASLPDLHRHEGQKEKRGHGRGRSRGRGRGRGNRGSGKPQDKRGAYSKECDQATYEEQGRQHVPENSRDETKTAEKADNFVLVKNLNPESTEDSIANYVERVLKTDVKRITFGTCDNKNAALVQIKQPPDWEHLKEFLERKPDRKCLDGAELQVIQVPPCKTVGISNLSNRTTKDGIKLKLEHPSCGGPGIVRDVKFKGGRNTTVVVFHKTEDVERVLEKEIKLDGSSWQIKPRYRFFTPVGMEDLLQLDNRIERQNDENGQKDNVQKIKKHKSAGSRQQSTEANASEMFPLTQDKIELLKISESLTEIIETYNTKIEVTRDGIKISGEESKIDKVKLLIMQKLINVVQSSPKISRGAYNFLKTNAGKHSVDKFFYGMNVKVVWKLNQSNTEISLMSFSPSEMEIVKKALEENLQDVDIPLSNTEQQILKTDRGNTFIEDLRSRNAVSVEFHESKLVISGISLETSNAKRQIKKFIKINETGSKIITVKRGMFRFLFESAKSKLTDLEQKLKEQLVTIGKTPKHKNIVVIGCKLGLQNAISSVTELIADVYTKEMVLERPGIGKLFQKSLIKSAISGLEKEFNVVVIEAADDIEDPEEEPKVKTERSVSSGTLICCYQIQDKKTISVYHGDITKESVDIIVNPANRNLWLGGGVAGAILSAGGKAIQNECKKYIKEHEELEEGDIAVTNSGKLLCKKIVHAVGPKWPTEERHIGEKELASRRKNAEDNLNLVIKNTLQAAEKYCSIAIPAISSGVFGFPKDLCAEIILSAVCSFLKDNSSTKLQDIRLVNNDKETVNVFSKLFQKQFGASDNFVACSKDEELLPTPQSEREEYLKAGVRHAVPDKMSPPTSTKEDSVDSSITQNGITTELVIGDISKEKADVIVNSTSSSLSLSSNACSLALSQAAGLKLQMECNAYIQRRGSQVPTWDFVITSGGNLDCQFVFHCVCQDYTEKKLEELLMKIFKKASEHRMKSIALPALGTGTLNFPRDKCAESISKAIQLFSSTTPHTSLKVIKVVAFHADQPTIAAFKKVFTRNTVATEIGENFVRGEKIPSGVRRGASKYLSPRASSHNVRPASRFSFASLSCQLVHGDITSEETDAIVVVGDQGLNFGGAVGEAVLKKEGVVFRSKAEKYKPQQLGTTVLLKTSSMKVKYVAHLVASSHRPRYNDLVESVYQMFRDVDKHEIISISIPAIGSGVLGFSPEQSARIIVQAVATASASQDLSYLKKVHIVIYDQNMYETFRKEMISLFSCLDRNEEHQSVGVKSSLKPYTKSAVSVLSNLVTTKSKDVGKAHPKGHDANLAVDSVQEDYVTLVLYSFELRNILNVKRRMEKLVDENITSITTTKQSLTNLPREKKHSLMDYARSLNVSISVEEGGKVTITGCHEDTTKVLEHCHEIATNIVVEASHKEKGYLLAETVQWSKIASDGSRVEYDVSTNLKIEEASSKGENEIRLLLEDDHGIVYNTKFDLKALTVTSLKSGEVSKLERKEKGKGISLPDYWDPMPKDLYGKEKPYHVVTLSKTSSEYQQVATTFIRSSAGAINSSNIKEIRRIQNPQLYKSFMARKEAIDATRSHGSNEKQLFHGTSEEGVEQINHHGLNRSLAGKNGTAYGWGVYFAADSAYSAGYARAGPSGYRFMYLARVLAGEYTLGNSGMKTAPPKGQGSPTDIYDTVVNNMASPRIFVVFYDNQCYAEYLLVFQ